MDPLDPRHGTRPGYYAHRKVGETACNPCKAAAAKAEQNRQLSLMRGINGRLDPTGTRRRLQALAWLGYGWKELAEHIGAQENMVIRWARRDAPGSYVFRDTAAKVADVYERLSMRPAPTDTTAQKNTAARARNRARRNGWLPPLAWDNIDNPNERPDLRSNSHVHETADPSIVERFIRHSDHSLDCNPAERMEIIRRWVNSGRSQRELERVTGWNIRRDIRVHGPEHPATVAAVSRKDAA